MKDKKRSTEEFEHWSVWEQDTYQTGSTCPPKSYGGIIAFLLVLVIFLCGLSTALGLMNIRLFRQLNAAGIPTENPLAFSQVAEEATADFFSPLGFSGQTIPEIWCLYENIPQGIYITEVAHNSDAAVKGIVPGDILIGVDGVPVPDTATLNQLLQTRTAHTAVQVCIYRDGGQLQFPLTLS